MLDTSAYPYDDEQILRSRRGCGGFAGSRCRTVPISIQFARSWSTFVGGLSVRAARPNILGPFAVDTEVEGVGRSRVFRGKDVDGDHVVLRAYPMDGWGPGVDPTAAREARASGNQADRRHPALVERRGDLRRRREALDHPPHSTDPQCVARAACRCDSISRSRTARVSPSGPPTSSWTRSMPSPRFMPRASFTAG